MSSTADLPQPKKKKPAAATKQRKDAAGAAGKALDVESLRAEGGALQRGLAILDVLIAAERPLPLGEVSELVGLTPSTVHRLLQNLIQAERVYRDESGRFAMTGKALIPLGLYHPLNALRRDARDPLRDLQKKYGPTATLSVFVGGHRAILEMSPGDDSFVPYFDTHLNTPLHATVSGKLFLASLSQERRRELLGPEPYPLCTANTISDAATLEAELAETDSRGYAFNLDEHYQGISAVGAAIRLQNAVTVGAVVLTGPSKYFPRDRLHDMAADLVHTAQLFSFASPSMRAVARLLGLKGLDGGPAYFQARHT